MMYRGTEIILSNYALQDSEERLFPASRHRSKRVFKKLIQRFGGEFVQVPCIFKVGSKFVMHPERFVAFKAALETQ